jgi:hypothetical protein
VTASTRQRAWRSTTIHCGSLVAARQPEPFTPVCASPSTANWAGVAAYAVEETFTGRLRARSVTVAAAAGSGRTDPTEMLASTPPVPAMNVLRDNVIDHSQGGGLTSDT